MTGRLFIGLLICLVLWMCASTLRWMWRRLFGVQAPERVQKAHLLVRVGDQLLGWLIKIAAAIVGVILVLLAAVLISRELSKSEEASWSSGGISLWSKMPRHFATHLEASLRVGMSEARLSQPKT